MSSLLSARAFAKMVHTATGRADKRKHSSANCSGPLWSVATWGLRRSRAEHLHAAESLREQFIQPAHSQHRCCASAAVNMLLPPPTASTACNQGSTANVGTEHAPRASDAAARPGQASPSRTLKHISNTLGDADCKISCCCGSMRKHQIRQLRLLLWDAARKGTPCEDQHGH